MPSNSGASVNATMRRGKVRRALAVLGVAVLLQHWFSFVIPAMPSFALRVAEISPYLQFLIPYLLNWGLVIGLVFVVLGVCLLWATWGLRPELAGGKSAKANSVSRAQQDERHRPTLRRILSYVKPHWPYVAGILAAIVTAAALDLYQVWIIAFLFIGEVGYRSNIGILPSIVTLLAMTFVVKEFASFLKDYLSEVLSQKTVHKLRSDLYEHVERQPMNVLDGSRSGELISRVVSDTGEVEKVLTDNFADLVTNAVMVAGATGLLFFVNAGLATIVVPLAVVMVVVVNRFKLVIKVAARRIREAIAELTARAFEVVSGLRIVKSFVMERHEADAFRGRSLAIAKAKVRLAQLSGIYSTTVDFVTLCALMAVVWFAAPAIVSKTLLVPALVAFLGYMDKMFKPLVVLSKVNFTLQKAVAAGDRIFELMDARAEVLESADGLVPQRIEGRIEFDQVTFGYRPTQNVLEDFSLTILPGETVAVVGSSGAGKSTIVNLLLRFYEPARGRILVDGHPVDRLNLKELRTRIGLVLQEPVLFSGTIRENIQYGDLSASNEKILKAAKAANAHDFIADLPKGYDTEIGERGVALSVGQRQRIAIARVLLKNPSILILDEATSNIDSESESLIQEALRRLERRRTMIVIGHRLSSIMDADRIVVLEDGGVAEVGTHADLLERGGAYTRLYEAQIARGASGDMTDDEPIWHPAP